MWSDDQTEPAVPESIPESPPAPSSPHHRNLRRALAMFYAVGAVFLLVAITSSVERTGGRTSPPWWALLTALLCALLALRSGAAGWTWLLADHHDRPALRRCVYESQLGKYIPGGVTQAAAQVAMAVRVGIPGRDALTAYLLYVGHVVLGFFAMSVLLTVQGAAVGWGWAFVGALGLLAVVPVRRTFVTRLLALGAKLVQRIGRLGVIPGQQALNRCFVGQVGFALGQGLAFALVLRSIDADAPIVAATGAYGLAFAIGLLAVPVPSGLLVREAILVAILHAAVPSGTIVAAAVFHRLVVIASEVLALAGSQVGRRLSDRQHPTGAA